MGAVKKWKSSILGPTTSKTAAMVDSSRHCVGMDQADVELGLLQEANIMDMIYDWEST